MLGNVSESRAVPKIGRSLRFSKPQNLLAHVDTRGQKRSLTSSFSSWWKSAGFASVAAAQDEGAVDESDVTELALSQILLFNQLLHVSRQSGDLDWGLLLDTYHHVFGYH